MAVKFKPCCSPRRIYLVTASPETMSCEDVWKNGFEELSGREEWICRMAVEILNLKDNVEKDTFFRKLLNLAEQLPRQIVLKKLLPLLVSALEFGSAAAPALTALLEMGSWLSVEDFRVKVLPTIVKLFSSNDRGVRVALLQQLEACFFGSAYYSFFIFILQWGFASIEQKASFLYFAMGLGSIEQKASFL